MPAEQEQAITVSRSGRELPLPEKTGSQANESYIGQGTGEGVFGGVVTVARSPQVFPRAPKKEKNGAVRLSPNAEVRRAFRVHWQATNEAAEAMLEAAEGGDLMGVGVAADRLDQSLADLWKLRQGRDLDWQAILNHMQGMMRIFFLEKRAETLTTAQCKRIVELVRDYLGPATKTIDDLNEVLRLIDDAGFDPFAAISAEPGAEAD